MDTKSNAEMTLETLRMLGAFSLYCECGLKTKGALEAYLDIKKECNTICSFLNEALKTIDKVQGSNTLDQINHSFNAKSILEKASFNLQALVLPKETKAEYDALLSQIAEAEKYADSVQIPFDEPEDINFVLAQKTHNTIKIALGSVNVLLTKLASCLELSAFEDYEMNSKAWADLDLKESLEALIKGAKELGELQIRQIDEYEQAFKEALESIRPFLEEALEAIKKVQTNHSDKEQDKNASRAFDVLGQALNILKELYWPLDLLGENLGLFIDVKSAHEDADLIAYIAYSHIRSSGSNPTLSPFFALSSPASPNASSKAKETQLHIEAALNNLSNVIQKFIELQRDSKAQAEARVLEVIKILESFKESDQDQSLDQSVSALKAVSAWLFSLLEISDKIENFDDDLYVEKFLATRKKIHEGFKQFDESI